MIGISIRLALALGLHLRNEDPSANLNKRESLSRTWWSLHMIECLVGAITGRPSVLAAEDCTVALPQDLSKQPISTSKSRRTSTMRKEYSSPHGSTRSSSSILNEGMAKDAPFQNLSIQLSLISQKALLELYAPRNAARSWQDIQVKIKELLVELEDWARLALADDEPPSYEYRGAGRERKQFLLRINYWSLKILITRPCLCRIERRISKQSDKSRDFNTQAAEICVDAAQGLANTFPDKPDLAFIYDQGPWWNIVHVAMQCIAVMLLEIAYEGKQLKEKKDGILATLKKMLRWLRAMQVNDLVAARAYNVIWTILKTCAPALQSQADEILADDAEYARDAFSGTRKSTLRSHQDNFAKPGPPPILNALFQEEQSMAMPGSDTMPFSHGDTSSSYQAPMSFGNPFYTGFDQSSPGTNLRGFWTDPGAEFSMSTDFTTLSFQQQQDMRSQGTEIIQQNVPESEFDQGYAGEHNISRSFWEPQ